MSNIVPNTNTNTNPKKKTGQINKIIHQLWIGTKPAPTTLMNTWKDKNPTFEYIFWNEAEFEKRGMKFECQEKIDDIEEINGKADIMRWEILYHYGGVFLDADSICVEPIDDTLMTKSCFAGWENEELRPGLIATGTMGFPVNHNLPKCAIQWILNNNVSQSKAQLMAWQSVGPGLLTRMFNTALFTDLHIFPSYTFLPIHLTGREYSGHGKIYAYQAWGSTKQSYDTLNGLQLPPQFDTSIQPNYAVSILISSYNTKAHYIKECLESIKHQTGVFQMEIVWINDGSTPFHTSILKKYLDEFVKTTRYTSLVYEENHTNMGIGFSLNKGINLCSNEIIVKMDSDDIMFPQRIFTQLEFFIQNPQAQICGCQVAGFQENNIKNVSFLTKHKTITKEEYLANPSHWISNHPSLCYKKSAVLLAGNYDATRRRMVEDFEFTLRMLKTTGCLYNLQDCLLYYRQHDEQVTTDNKTDKGEYWKLVRNQIIRDLFFS
jgi:mannosyltransferase OCH1-like enzyme